MIEEQVKKFGGQHAEEIIQSVKTLAEVDVEIKTAMDEIERIDDELFRRHNDLVDRINRLIKDAFSDSDEAENTFSDQNRTDGNCDMKIRAEIRITKRG